MINVIQEELALAKSKMIEEVVCDNYTLAKLSRENVAIVEAMIRNDSAYIHSTDVGAKPSFNGYTGAVKPPVRRTGNRKSGPEETGIYAAEPPSRRNSFPGWGRQLIGYIIRSVPDPVRIPLSWSGSWQDRSERC